VIALLETTLWLLVGLASLAMFGLAIRIALDAFEISRGVEWAFVIGAPVVASILMGLVAWLLLIVALVLAARWLVLSFAGVARVRPLLLRACLAAGIGLFPLWYFAGITNLEHVIVSAVDGDIRTDAAGAVRWDLVRSGAEPPWLRDLPAAVDARCAVELFPNGACCRVGYPDGRSSEVHIFRTGLGRYTIRKLTDPSNTGLCRNPHFDPSGDPRVTAGREFVPCNRLEG